MQTYREQIISVVNNLSEAREIIFGQIVSFGMKKEFPKIDEALDEGDTYSFELAHFEDAKDINLARLVELCKKVEATIFDLIDLNQIKDEELDLH